MPPFGILEPKDTYASGVPREAELEAESPLDLVVMPGLGFDRMGGRLGRGGGYYDKLLSQIRARCQERGWRPPLLVALAFDAQVLDSPVPRDPHDMPIDVLVTPNRVQQFRQE